jgi:hypothetical protein
MKMHETALRLTFAAAVSLLVPMCLAAQSTTPTRATQKLAEHRAKQQQQVEALHTQMQDLLSALEQRSNGKATGKMNLGLYTRDPKAFQASLRRIRPDHRREILDFYRDLEDFNFNAAPSNAEQARAQAAALVPQQRGRFEASQVAEYAGKRKQRDGEQRLEIPAGKLKSLPEHVKRKGQEKGR